MLAVGVPSGHEGMKQLTGKALSDFLERDEHPPRDVVFVLQDVEDPVNVGAAFRIADACGAREIVLSGTSPCPPHPTIAGIGRGTHRRVPWCYTRTAREGIQSYRDRGFRAYALEVTAESLPYHSITYPAKLCLVVGSEYHGVTKRTLAACDVALYIPMYGKIGSLNVHVALAVVAFHILHTQAPA